MSPRTTLSALTLVTLIATLVPSTSFAASCSLAGLDTVAGLGTQITAQGCAPRATVPVTIVTPSGAQTTQNITTDATGNGVALLASHATEAAGVYRVESAGTTTSFTVLPDRDDPAHSVIDASPATVDGIGKRTTVTVVLRDRYDNPIARRPLGLMSSRASDTMQPRTAETDDNGRASWTLTPTEAGKAVLTPYDMITSRPLGLSTTFTVGGMASASLVRASLTGLESGGDLPASVSTFVGAYCILSPKNFSKNVPLNELFSLTIVAVQDGSTCAKLSSGSIDEKTLQQSAVRSYMGTVAIESSDGASELPNKGNNPAIPQAGIVEFRNIDQGVRMIPLSFSFTSPGKQTLRVYDPESPAIMGEASFNDATAGAIRIMSPTTGQRVPRTDTLLVQGQAPSLVPVVIRGGAQTVTKPADEYGIFRIDVPLPKGQSEVTLFAGTSGGELEPDQIHIIIDDTKPAITTASITPERGRTDTDATITVISEPSLGAVTATVGTTTATLQPSTATPGTYAGTLRAPTKEGTYDVTITATDTVGNATTMLLKWNVLPRDVPTVSGLTAETNDSRVALRWLPVDGVSVQEYRIYIARATEPDNILYSIGTGKPVTSAIIQDLPRGNSYRISVTAKTTDGAESATKSEPVTVTVAGLQITATPSANGLLLQWEPVTNLPVSQYILSFGTEAGVYPETRRIDGSARSTTIRDLIEGVTYEFRLTPVLVNGQPAPNLAALARITAGATSMSSADPVPTDIAPPLHPGADLAPPLPIRDVPSIASSGLSTIALVLGAIIAALLGVMVWHGRREHDAARAFLSSHLRSSPPR